MKSAVTRPGEAEARARPVPPPGAVLLSVGGLRGVLDQAAVLAALRARDPAAHVWTDWPRGLLAVQSDHPPEALRLAVQEAGFVAAWLPHLPTDAGGRGLGAGIVRILGHGFAGFVLGTLAGAAAAIAVTMFDPSCGVPGDGGGCAMGIPSVALGGGMLGTGLGVALALLRTLRGR